VVDHALGQVVPLDRTIVEGSIPTFVAGDPLPIG
jgi:hypothetical protein